MVVVIRMLAVEGDDQLQITAPSAVTAAVEVPQVSFAFPDTNWVWVTGIVERAV